MKNTIRLIQIELKRVFLSKEFYLTAIIIIVCGFITLNRNYTVKNLKMLTNIGTLNMFIYSNIVSNVFVTLIAPVLAGLGYSLTAVEDYKTKYYRQLIIRTDVKHYFTAKSVTALISGAGLFLIAYALMFILLFIIEPSASVRTDFPRTTTFGLIYDNSMFLYCITFIGYTMLFGSVYSLFSLSVAFLFKNKFLALGIPFFIYYASCYAYVFFPRNTADTLSYFIPNQSFNILNGQTFLQYCSQLAIMILVSVIIIYAIAKSINKQGS